MKKITNMIRLLIVFKSEKPFGGDLYEKGVFNTFNEAVAAAIPLIDDNTIETILINNDSQWVRIK
jgi:hypothetical protein